MEVKYYTNNILMTTLWSIGYVSVEQNSVIMQLILVLTVLLKDNIALIHFISIV